MTREISESASDLHELRLETVLRTLLETGAASVLDLGCGPGELLSRLVTEEKFKKIVGIDTSQEALTAARHLLGLKAGDSKEPRLLLYQASFTTFVEELVGFDAAVMVETIEHVEPNRLSAVEQAVFAGYCPKTVLVTTPNREYNVLHGLPKGALRHQGHRFEWTRSKFSNWAQGVALRNGYRVAFEDIGPADPVLGSSTQMAKFDRT